jgi:sugar phosphate isomerase/epimerase
MHRCSALSFVFRLFKQMNSPRLSLQLYSLRRETSADAEATVRQVPQLGYDSVELAGDYGWDARKWRSVLDETSLAVVGAHVSLAALEKELAALVGFHKTIGNTRLIVPSLPGELQTRVGYRDAAQRLTMLSRKLRDEGFATLYHNHAFEFVRLDDGSRGMDILLNETDAADVQFEFDTYWLERGGEDARAFLENHAARVGMIHAKDLRKRDGADVPAGQGNVDFKAIIPLAIERGWPVVVEFEGEDAVAAVGESAGYLRALL